MPVRYKPSIYLCSSNQMQLLKIRSILMDMGFIVILPSWSSEHTHEALPSSYTSEGLIQDLEDIKKATHFVFCTYNLDAWGTIMLGSALGLGLQVILIHDGPLVENIFKLPQIAHYTSIDQVIWPLMPKIAKRHMVKVKHTQLTLLKKKLYSLMGRQRTFRTRYKIEKIREIRKMIKRIEKENASKT